MYSEHVERVLGVAMGYSLQGSPDSGLQAPFTERLMNLGITSAITSHGLYSGRNQSLRFQILVKYTTLQPLSLELKSMMKQYKNQQWTIMGEGNGFPGPWFIGYDV